MPEAKVRSFFRKVDKKLLKEYLDSKKIPYDGVDLLTITANNFHTLIEGLEKDLKTQVMKDFTEVEALTDDFGLDAIFETCLKLNKGFLVPKLGKIDGECSKVLFLLTNYEDIFNYVSRWRFFSDLKMHVEVDGLKKSNDLNPSDYEESLKKTVSDYLVRIESRGEKCLVESYKYEDRVCFMLNPVDHTKIGEDYDEESEQLKPFIYKPALQIAYSYYFKEGRLQINSPFQGEKQGQLLNIFNEVVLKDKTDISRASFVYNLNKVFDKDFKISLDAEDGISSCFLKEIKVRLKTGEVIGVNLDYKRTAYDCTIQDMLEALKRRSLDTSIIEEVTFANFRFGFNANNGSSIGNARIGKSGCNLSDTDKDKLIRKYLTKWGLRAKNIEDEESHE